MVEVYNLLLGKVEKRPEKNYTKGTYGALLPVNKL